MLAEAHRPIRKPSLSVATFRSIPIPGLTENLLFPTWVAATKWHFLSIVNHARAAEFTGPEEDPGQVKVPNRRGM